MTAANPFTIGLVLVGVFLAAFYGVLATVRLIRVTKLTPLAADHGEASASNEVPTMRFEGEAFEERWQGSRGYDRPADPAAGQNWTDRLVIPVFSPFRPSRFGDPSYWRRYLPGVLCVWAFFFVVLPLLIALVGHLGSFSPSAEQRAVPSHSAAYVSTPTGCDGSAPPAAPSTKAVPIDFTDDSHIVDVPAGSLVAIRYLYGRPLFSPGTPLCPIPSLEKSGVVVYRAAGSGSGYVYLPQPNGTQVVEIEVSWWRNPVLLGSLVVSALVVVYDVVVSVWLRRAVRSRYTATVD